MVENDGEFRGWSKAEIGNLKDDISEIKINVKENKEFFKKKIDELSRKVDPIIAFRNKMIGVAWIGSALLNIPALVFVIIKILDTIK